MMVVLTVSVERSHRQVMQILGSSLRRQILQKVVVSQVVINFAD